MLKYTGRAEISRGILFEPELHPENTPDAIDPDQVGGAAGDDLDPEAGEILPHPSS